METADRLQILEIGTQDSVQFQENLDKSSLVLLDEIVDEHSLGSSSSNSNESESSPILDAIPLSSKTLDEPSTSPPTDPSSKGEETEILDDSNHHQKEQQQEEEPSFLDWVSVEPRPQDYQAYYDPDPEPEYEDDNKEEDNNWESPWPYRRPHSRWGSNYSWFPPNEIKPTGVGAGLENLGNTCFINAILQCFTHTVPLVQGLRSCNHVNPCDGTSGGFCIICFLREHVDLSLGSSGKVISPLNLVNNINHISSMFQRYHQEDAHEFMQCLLDKLEISCLESQNIDKSLPSEDDNNIVKQIFGGRLVSKLRCCNCGHCSDTYEPLIDLSLEIEDVSSLQSALESFTKVEKIEDSETKFTCDNCKEVVSLEKQLLLDQLPSVAAFHLKRFKTDGSSVVKIDNHVDFPLEIDLKPYTSGGKNSDVELKYQLYAIVEHTGSSPTFGHYFSFVRSSPGTWHRLNDSRVCKVEEDFVLSQDAYILFYAKEGTAWFSSFFEAEKPCLGSNISNSSPKSVLDNMDSDFTAHPSVANAVNSDANESSDPAVHSSTEMCCETKPEDVEINETRGAAEKSSGCGRVLDVEVNVLGSRQNVPEVKETTEDTPMIDASELPLESECDDGMHSNEKFKINDVFHPLTPPRSPSPDKPSETRYRIPREHLKLDNLKLENRVTAKKPLFERGAKDVERKEAHRFLSKSTFGSRRMKLMAAMNEGASLNKSRLRIKSSPCKRDRSLGVRRKQNHASVVRRVTI